MFIKSIMIKIEDVITATTDTPLSVAATMLHENRIGLLVVSSDDGHVVGVLSERDFIRGISKNIETLHEMNVRDLMTTNPVTCMPDSDPVDIMNAMKEGHFRHMPVVEDDILVGLVSMTEITHFMLMT